jgi:hypothetical protein
MKFPSAAPKAPPSDPPTLPSPAKNPSHPRQTLPTRPPRPQLRLLRNMHDNLSPRPSRLEPLVPLGRILELKGRLDHSADLALLHPLPYQRQIIRAVLDLQQLQLPLAAAQQARPAQPRQQVVDAAQGRRHANLHVRGALVEEAVRRLVQVVWLADVVDDERELHALGRELLRHVRGPVVDDLVRAEVFAQLHVGRRAGRRDVAALDFGKLDAEDAGSAGAAVDKDLVARLDVRDDGLVGCQGGCAGCGGVVDVHAAWELDAARPLGGDVLAQGAEFDGLVEAAEDELAGLQDGFHGGAGGDDAAAVVDSGGCGLGDDESAHDGEFGQFVVDGVEGHADDFDGDLFCGESGWGRRCTWVDFEVLLEPAAGG